MPETISVITINYNNLKGLKRTFHSVDSQTARTAIQYVVVDGGSNDGSAEFLNENRSKIDVLISEKDKGIYDAMNKGLHASTGDYVWFVNSGDAIYKPRVTSELMQFVQQKRDVIFGDTMFIDDNGNEIGLISKLKPQKLTKTLNKNSFRFGMSVCHQSFIAKRNISPDYDLQYRQASDIDWILNVLKKNPDTVNTGTVLAAFETGGSSTQNEKKAWKERYNVLAKHYGKLPNAMAHIWIIFRRILFNAGIWRNKA